MGLEQFPIRDYQRHQDQEDCFSEKPKGRETNETDYLSEICKMILLKTESV